MSFIVFNIVDPTLFYHGARQGFNREWYNPEKGMSLSEEQVTNYYTETFDEQGNKLEWGEQKLPGQLYYEKSWGAAPDDPGNAFYVIPNNPFHTTLQVVGKRGNTLIVQDQFPDTEMHMNYSPHYRMTASDTMTALATLEVSNGRFSGQFKFRRRGKHDSIGLV